MGWLGELRYDPTPFLLESASVPLQYFVGRDLLGERSGPVEALWSDSGARRILARQRPDGRWEYPGGGTRRIRKREDYDQLETYRQLGLLVEKFGFSRKHPALRGAAEFMFSHQTGEGDFRGIYGRQYTPNYTAATMELLIKAGYEDDSRIEKGFRWLLSMRQEDGGWAVPSRTATRSVAWTRTMRLVPFQPDRSRPFSHLITGVVLRAFAAHKRRRESNEAKVAGELLAGRFFESDRYPDRRAPEFWKKVSFPFWFTDIVSALDSLSLLGLSPRRPDVRRALDWLKVHQERDGSFSLKLLRTAGEDLDRWVCLAVCRVVRRFYLAEA